MKELSIEEKAKVYDDALERAKNYKENTDGVGAKDVSAIIEGIFPQLKESKEEEIRELLVDYFKEIKKQQGEFDANSFCGIPTDSIIAWLEK